MIIPLLIQVGCFSTAALLAVWCAINGKIGEAGIILAVLYVGMMIREIE